jgi:hypothetical protein
MLSPTAAILPEKVPDVILSGQEVRLVNGWPPHWRNAMDKDKALKVFILQSSRPDKG